MVGRSKFGGIYSVLRSSELTDIQSVLANDEVIGDDEDINDFPLPVLLSRIEEGIDWIQSGITYESSFRDKDNLDEFSKSVGNLRRELIILQRAKRKIEAYIKKWENKTSVEVRKPGKGKLKKDRETGTLFRS